MGEHWEEKIKVPIPLGGIIANRKIDSSISLQIDTLIRKSVEYAYQNYTTELSDYIKCHAQEMSEYVMRKHINLYVNNHSIELGEDGRKAVLKLMEVYQELHPEIKITEQNIFIN